MPWSPREGRSLADPGQPPAEISLYNSYDHEIEPLDPIEPGKIRMYVCGVSVSGEPHVGHARSYIVFDVLRRVLEHAGYEVHHVQNFTDVEWAITKRAQAEGLSVETYAQEMIDAYFDTMDRLDILHAHDFPRVTEYLEKIIDATATLHDHECAYEIPDGLAFRVCDIEDFGGLLGRDPASAVVHAVPEEQWGGRESPFDFILWRDDLDLGQRWEAPWGMGRPGWHTECAVMATDLLGDTIDIHGGGMDLVFPHHESERAIARCLTGQPFANCWVHNGLVTMDKEKMSKSRGNYVTLAEAIEDHGPAKVRVACLLTYYRDTMEWSPALLARAEELLHTLEEALIEAQQGAPEGQLADQRDKLIGALRDDLSTTRALRLLTDMCRLHAGEPGSAPVLWEALDLLGLSNLEPLASIERKEA